MRVPDCTMDVLVAVVATAESRTKAEAASKLKVSISALDKRLKTASSLYGVALVDQNGGGLALTDAGHVFYSSARHSVELASLAEERTRAHLKLTRNRLVVGHSTYIAPRLLALIRQLKLDDYPRLRIDHKAGLTPSIARRVIHGELHAGFGFLPLTTPELVVHTVWDEPVDVCLPSSHPLSSRTALRPEDLDGQPTIAVAREAMPAMHGEVEAYFAALGAALPIVADAFAPEEALTLVEQKVGLCLLARSSAVPRRGVTVRPLSTESLRRHTGFFYREDNREPLLIELSGTVLEQTQRTRRHYDSPVRRRKSADE